MSAEPPRAAPASHIECPSCRRLLYGIRDPLPQPDACICSSDIVPCAGVPAPQPGEDTACPFCGAPLQDAIWAAFQRASAVPER